MGGGSILITFSSDFLGETFKAFCERGDVLGEVLVTRSGDFLGEVLMTFFGDFLGETFIAFFGDLLGETLTALFWECLGDFLGLGVDLEVDDGDIVFSSMSSNSTAAGPPAPGSSLMSSHPSFFDLEFCKDGGAFFLNSAM